MISGIATKYLPDADSAFLTSAYALPARITCTDTESQSASAIIATAVFSEDGDIQVLFPTDSKHYNLVANLRWIAR